MIAGIVAEGKGCPLAKSFGNCAVAGESIAALKQLAIRSRSDWVAAEAAAISLRLDPFEKS
jgi:hypothetical protein